MKRVSALMTVLLLAGAAQGQSPQVNQAEILRLGDMVQHVNGYRYGQSAEDALIEAMRPPASDADKWFISVIVSRSCAACLQLKADWANDPSLLALADPNEPYDGKPRALALDIAQTIRRYVAKLAEADGVSQTAGVAPPWQPAPVNEPAPNQGRRLIPPLVPEDVSVQVDFPWKAILTLFTAGFSIPAVTALVIWLLTVVRAGRKEADKPLLLEDETFQKLIDALDRLGTAEEPKKARTTRKRTTTAKR